ncbi:hypothetical protein VULLAG_LOCUS12914 [Vulpes lagopus]
MAEVGRTRREPPESRGLDVTRVNPHLPSSKDVTPGGPASTCALDADSQQLEGSD